MFYLNSHGVGAHLIQQKLIELLKTILQQDRPLKNCLTLKSQFFVTKPFLKQCLNGKFQSQSSFDFW